MKQALLLFFAFILSIPAFSQCVPNEIYRDSMIGVYPPPDTMGVDDPDRGITESACINSGYEFVLTFKIPSDFNGFQLDSVVIAESGAVIGLPLGMSYNCFPENCVFTPADTIACLAIVGTANDQNTPGDFDLTINTTIYTPFITDEVPFPNNFLPGADGNYILKLLPEGDPNCFIAGVNDPINSNIQVTNSPNPFSTITNIEVISTFNEELDFTVYDMLGNLVHTRKVDLVEGENNFQFDGAHLSNGIYTMSLSNNLGAITRKIVVSR